MALEGKQDFNSPSAPSECVQFVVGGTPWLAGAARTNPDPSQEGLDWFIFHIIKCVKGWASVLATESRDGSTQQFLMFHQTPRLKLLLIASFHCILNRFLSNYEQ